MFEMVMSDTIMTMSSARWNVASAKAGLSRLLRAAERRPQFIEKRGRPVAVVVSADEFERVTDAGQAGKRWDDVLALSDEIRAEGGTDLRIAPRRSRPSPFARRRR